jgi:hypothetical protein
LAADKYRTIIRRKFTRWRNRSKIASYTKKWEIGLKRSTEKVGKALTELTDD